MLETWLERKAKEKRMESRIKTRELKQQANSRSMMLETYSDEGDRHPEASSPGLGKFRDYCEVHNS